MNKTHLDFDLKETISEDEARFYSKEIYVPELGTIYKINIDADFFDSLSNEDKEKAVDNFLSHNELKYKIDRDLNGK